jgi:hypothetical protein
MGEPARESGREIANFRVGCALIQPAHVRYRTFLTSSLTRRGRRFHDDRRFIDDVLAVDHLAIPQLGLVVGPDRRVPFTRCPRYGFLVWWGSLRWGGCDGEGRSACNGVGVGTCS